MLRVFTLIRLTDILMGILMRFYSLVTDIYNKFAKFRDKKSVYSISPFGCCFDFLNWKMLFPATMHYKDILVGV